MPASVVALALLSAALLALGLVLTQLGVHRLEPIRGACVSVPTTTVLFLALSPLALDVQNFHAPSAALFLLAGCLFPAAVTLLTFEANRRIGPNLTGALGNLTPLFAILVAFILLGEVPRPGQLAGTGVILAGVLLLIGAPRGTPGGPMGLAMLLALGAVVIRGLVQPVVKLGLESWPSPFAAALIGYVVSALVVLSAGAATHGRAILTPPRGGRILFVAIGLCNGLAVLCMYAALARGPVALVAPLVACYPLATLVFSHFLLGPGQLSLHMALGVVLTVAGVGLLLRA